MSTLIQGAGILPRMPTDFGKRVKAARKHAQLNQKQLAAAVGVSQSNISQIEASAYESAFTTQIAAACGVNPLWLATGDGEMIDIRTISNDVSKYENLLPSEAANVEGAPALVKARKVPVIGEVKGGLDGYFDELMYPVGHGEGYVEYWCRDESAYALRVRGDSMHPRYRAGEFVVVTPSIEAQPGSDVVIQLVDGRKLLKQLNWIRDDEIQLLSINNGYEPLTLSKSEVLSMQPVGGGVPRHAFINH